VNKAILVCNSNFSEYSLVANTAWLNCPESGMAGICDVVGGLLVMFTGSSGVGVSVE